MVHSYSRVKIWYIRACSNLYSQLNFKKNWSDFFIEPVNYKYHTPTTTHNDQPTPKQGCLSTENHTHMCSDLIKSDFFPTSHLIFFHFFFRRGSPLYAHLWIFDRPNSNKWTFTVIRGQAGQLPKRHSNHWCVMTEVQTSTNVFRKLRWILSSYYTECLPVLHVPSYLTVTGYLLL